MADFKVSVLTGAVTETESLRKTVMTVLETCNHSDLAEIIICYPDRVTPECKAVIDELCSMPCDVPVIPYKQVLPRMGFIKELIEMAKGTHCITVDSDLALDVTLIPEMIKVAKSEPDVIVSASRWMKGGNFSGYNPAKLVLNFAAQKFLSVLFGGNLTDYTIPFQIAPVKVYKSINFESNEFPLLLELVLKPLRLGSEFIEVPTECRAREQGKSSNSFLQTAKYLSTALRIRFMKKEDIIKK